MTIPSDEINGTVFKRSSSVNLSDYGDDVKTFNVLFALDGKRSVETIAAQDAFDLPDLVIRIKDLQAQGLIEAVDRARVSRGHAKKLLDAIILKRSRGVGAIAKAIKIKLALKGINPDSLTYDTPDDPALLKKLIALAQSYGLQVRVGSPRTTGRTKLILDSIITQRSGGDPMVAKVIKTKLMLKGINPDAYSLDTPDDPNQVKKLMDLAAKLGVTIAAAPGRIGNQIEKIL